MAIKAIFMDMDGTLLRSDLTISEDLKKKLAELDARGIKVCISTGRTYKASKKYIDELEMVKDPSIHYCGCMIVDADGKILEEKSVGAKEVEEIIKIARELDVHLNLYYNDNMCIEKENPEGLEYARKTGLTYILDSFDNYIGKTSTKALFLAENEKLVKIQEMLADKFPNLAFVFSQHTYLEIFDKNVNKGTAVLEMIEKYGITPEETMAFGDQWNDFEMLKAVKYGFLMGNATDDLKKHFPEDRITLSNDEEGILRVLEKIDEKCEINL